MGQQGRQWRRRVYVHPIQRKYFFLSLVPLIVCAFLLIAVVFIPLHLAVRDPASDPGEVAALGQSYALAVRIWPPFILSMLASCLFSFFITHKFAGALYRIEQVVRRAAEGDLPRAIRLRRRDDLQEFAGLLERAFETITSALMAVQEREALTMKELAALQANVKSGSNDAGEILRHLEGIADRQREVEAILATFRLPSRNGDGPKADQPSWNEATL